jgi:hypothetical protein
MVERHRRFRSRPLRRRGSVQVLTARETVVGGPGRGSDVVPGLPERALPGRSSEVTPKSPSSGALRVALPGNIPDGSPLVRESLMVFPEGLPQGRSPWPEPAGCGEVKWSN